MFAAATGNDFPYITAITSALAAVFAAWTADERHNRRRLELELDKKDHRINELTDGFIEMQGRTVGATTEQSIAMTRAGEAVTKAEEVITRQSQALSDATAEIRSAQFKRQGRGN